MSIKVNILSVLAGTLAFGSAIANGDAAIRSFVESQLKAHLASDLVIDAIRQQNDKHANLSQADIDELDLQWRAETDGQAGSLIDDTLSTPLSSYLSEVLEDSAGIYTEIFVMDNRGLNVGQSGLTSDYWQGDESKWQQTYLVGADAVHASDVEFDESSQTYQLQISVAIVDPNTNENIGAATFGVNADALQQISLDDLN